MIIGILMTIIEHFAPVYGQYDMIYDIFLIFGPVYGQPGKQHEPRLQGHALKKRLKMTNIWIKANDFMMFAKVPLNLSSLYGRIKE